MIKSSFKVPGWKEKSGEGKEEGENSVP